MSGQGVLRCWQRDAAQFTYMLSGYLPDGYPVRLSSLSSEAALAYRQQLIFF